MTGRDSTESHRASTSLELLFDLTFVVAVSQAARELAAAVAAGPSVHAVEAYLMVFFAIYWGWLNFTWFASAYDTDDVPYRLLTLLQMGGVLVVAAAVPSAFETGRFTWVVVGYVIMRVTMVAQWLRAAREDPAGRRTAQRYAFGITIVQLGWILRLWLPGQLATASFVVLVACELAVPWRAEQPDMTPWHPAHIAERYGLFTIIVLGECVAAVAVAVQTSLASGGATGNLVVTGLAGLILLFGCWWLYFLRSSPRALARRGSATFVWGYLHYVAFAALAALGAGLEVLTETITHGTEDGGEAVEAGFAGGPLTAGLAVAIPVAVFLVLVGVLQTTLGDGGRPPLVSYVLAAVLQLAAGAALAILWLPAVAMIAAVAVAAVVVAGVRSQQLAAGSIRRRTAPAAA